MPLDVDKPTPNVGDGGSWYVFAARARMRSGYSQQLVSLVSADWRFCFRLEVPAEQTVYKQTNSHCIQIVP